MVCVCGVYWCGWVCVGMVGGVCWVWHVLVCECVWCMIVECVGVCVV